MNIFPKFYCPKWLEAIAAEFGLAAKASYIEKCKELDVDVLMAIDSFNKKGADAILVDIIEEKKNSKKNSSFSSKDEAI